MCVYRVILAKVPLGADHHYENIGNTGATALAFALRRNRTLTHVSLRGQFIKVSVVHCKVVWMCVTPHV
mgnify:CR=1 FL=1